MTYVLIPPNLLPRIDVTVGASLRYGIDIQDILGEGDAVATVDASGTGDITVSASEFNGTILSAHVDAGTTPGLATLTLSWTCAEGDDSRTLYLRIVER